MLHAAEIESLLTPYLATPLPSWIPEKLATYLDLLLRWNARTNLTAIRDPREIVLRHFGESLFAAQNLPFFQTLLDFGSGAGFPGIPIQLLHPTAQITLAESQGKKASFLREAVRTLELSTQVWAKRAEDLPASATFDLITLRAVDNMETAMEAAAPHLSPHGQLAVLAGTGTLLHPSMEWHLPILIPNPAIHLVLSQKPTPSS